MRRLRWVGAAGALVLAGTAAPLIAVPAASASRLVVLTRSAAPRLPTGALALGPVPARRTVHFDITLKTRNAAALQVYLAALRNPRSPDFRHFLTPAQYDARFGSTAAELRTVTAQLRAMGLRPGRVSVGSQLVPVSASAPVIRRALRTELLRYRLPGGRIVFANRVAPSIPRELAGSVAGIVGLDDLALATAAPVRLGTRSAARSGLRAHLSGAPSECSPAAGNPYLYGANTPAQLASAYGFGPLYAAGDYGAGVNVAIIEAEPFTQSDINQYQSCFGTSTSVNAVSVTNGNSVVGNATAPQSSAEAALDIETVIGLAPQASIWVYNETQDANVLLNAYEAAINPSSAVLGAQTPPLPQVISTSWGACQHSVTLALLDEEQALFAQADSQGQTVFAAAGDNGSSDCSGSAAPAVDDPADQPYVVGVGGTTLTPGTATSAQSETTWNNSGGVGGGGVDAYRSPTTGDPGPSAFGAIPPYQAAALVPSLNPTSSCSIPAGGATTYCRQVPDVAAAADPGYAIYWTAPLGSGDTSQWQPYGGTSAAAPLWAAAAALIEASPYCASSGTPQMFDFAPVLYKTLSTNPLTGASYWSSSFYDVTTGNNGAYAAGPGYDLTTGLGTPVLESGNGTGPGLAASLCALEFPTNTASWTPNVTGLSVTSAPDDSTSTLGITGTNFLTVPGAETVEIGATTVNDVSCVSSTQCSATLPVTGVPESGAVSVVAEHLAASAGYGSFTFTKASPPLAVTAFPATIAHGSSGLVSVASLIGAATGTVSFSSGGTVLCTVDLATARSCATPANLAAGNYPVNATYSGDANFLPSSAATSFSVSPAATSLSVSAAPAAIAYDHRITLSASGLPAGVSGTVTFSANGAVLCSFTVGFASSCATSGQLAAGAYPVTAAYSGYSQAAASQATTAFVISKAPTAITATTYPTEVAQNSPVTLVATGVPSGSTGTVTFKAGARTLCVFHLPAASGCRVPARLGVGSYSLVATYSGDVNHGPARATTRLTVSASRKLAPGTRMRCLVTRELVVLRQVVTRHHKRVVVTTRRKVPVRVCTPIAGKAHAKARSKAHAKTRARAHEKARGTRRTTARARVTTTA